MWIKLYTQTFVALLLAMSAMTTTAAPQEAPASDFGYTIQGGTVTLTKYKGKAKELVIPEKIEDCPVTKLADRLCCENASLVRVSIPDTVTEIGFGAFYTCLNLESVKMSENIASMRGDCFSGCRKLKEISVPKRISTGPWVFNECTSLDTLITGDGEQLLRIGANVREYTVPASIREVAMSAFDGSAQIKRIIFEDAVTYIDGHTFARCKNLISVTLPQTLESIRDREAFAFCPSLKELIFMGDCPVIDDKDLFKHSPNVIVYYNPSAQGWEPDKRGKWTEYDMPLRPLDKSKIKQNTSLQKTSLTKPTAPQQANAPAATTAAEQLGDAEEQLAATCAEFKNVWDVYKVNAEKINAELQPKFDALQQQYQKALETLKSTAQNRGDLEKVKAIIAEMERFEATKNIPSAPDEETIAEIKNLYANAAKPFAALEKDKASRMTALTKRYGQALEQLQASLVKAGKLDEATAVKAARERAKQAE